MINPLANVDGGASLPRHFFRLPQVTSFTLIKCITTYFIIIKCLLHLSHWSKWSNMASTSSLVASLRILFKISFSDSLQVMVRSSLVSCPLYPY